MLRLLLLILENWGSSWRNQPFSELAETSPTSSTIVTWLFKV
jgi:hypothetical protein